MATNSIIDLAPVQSFGIDYSQYTGLWLVDETRFGTMLDCIGKMDLAAHIKLNMGQPQIEAKASMATARSGSKAINIGIVEIDGTLTKRGSSLSPAGSSVMLRQSIRRAANSDSVDGILLKVDSPGGTVAGTADLAAEIRSARERKPVWAFVEDLAASAAYWAASQADKVYANNATALIGSIGTYMGLYDYSGEAAQKGIKAVVIRSGAHKGAGFPGTEITQEQREMWQEIIDKTQAEFTAGVAEGRGLSVKRVEELADGRAWVATDAIENKLIDGIATLDETLQRLAADVQRRNSSYRKKDKKMTDDSNAPLAANYAEVKAACPGADSTFICAQLERSATAEQASSAWTGELMRRVDAATEAQVKAEKEAADAKAELEEARKASASRGQRPLGGHRSSGDTGNPEAEFWAAVKVEQDSGKTKRQAVATVARENPELHQAYIAAVNA